MQTIKRLPKSVHSSLRSSIVLFDLSRVVEELVYNSIDADASKVLLSHTKTANYYACSIFSDISFLFYSFQIDISVNVRACFVKVEDDGMSL